MGSDPTHYVGSCPPPSQYNNAGVVVLALSPDDETYLLREGLFSLVILTSRFLKQHDGYFGTDLVALNRGQMTRTTPELVPPSLNFHTTSVGKRLTPHV
ncbi:hypothetical protein AVEN_57815-1 [Araneus ventricosus]|uniref:Uncharacterized protein n=1 Tax=Araneus ventricosus TaxID=182803 RepID=A0A4Y2I8R5_ARAVE|nr:hypothetical protein AVEN_57815-1 [Araneus ventricosus]